MSTPSLMRLNTRLFINRLTGNFVDPSFIGHGSAVPWPAVRRNKKEVFKRLGYIYCIVFSHGTQRY